MVEKRKRERKRRKPEYVAPVKSKYRVKKSEPPKKEWLRFFIYSPKLGLLITSHATHWSLEG